MKKYEVMRKRFWQSKDGRRASIYGSYPGDEWEMITEGWTIRNNITNTVGVYNGGKPFASKAEAQSFCDKFNR